MVKWGFEHVIVLVVTLTGRATPNLYSVIRTRCLKFNFMIATHSIIEAKASHNDLTSLHVFSIFGCQKHMYPKTHDEKKIQTHLSSQSCGTMCGEDSAKPNHETHHRSRRCSSPLPGTRRGRKKVTGLEMVPTDGGRMAGWWFWQWSFHFFERSFFQFFRFLDDFELHEVVFHIFFCFCPSLLAKTEGILNIFWRSSEYCTWFLSGLELRWSRLVLIGYWGIDTWQICSFPPFDKRWIRPGNLHFWHTFFFAAHLPFFHENTRIYYI